MRIVAVPALLLLLRRVQATDWYPYTTDNWATAVHSANTICKDGTEQSPIDFPACSNPMTRAAPTITWKTQAIDLQNTATSIKLKVKDAAPGGMSFVIGGITKAYTLVQCHFHWPSEHTVGWTAQPFEAHCVHSMDASNGQRFGVFGIFYQIGNTANAFLGLIENVLPTHTYSVGKRRMEALNVSFDLFGNPLDPVTKRRLMGKTPVTATFSTPIDFKKLYDGVPLTKYWNYDGSFTTPPCTEAVDFYIFTTKAVMTQAQLDKFKNAIGWKVAGGNYRPPQKLNSRTIYGCTTEPSATGDKAWYPYNAAYWEDSVGANSHALCRFGTKQSPIDFQECATPQARTAIAITWKTQTVELINNGHTVQLTAKDAAPGQMTVNAKTYTLVQCHFHFGSEHTHGGMQMPFEAHCVHSKDGSGGQHFGVFGLFYETCDASCNNAFFTPFEDLLPGKPTARRLGSEEVPFNVYGEPMDAAPERRLAGKTTSSYTGPLNFQTLYGSDTRVNYWDYEGSFTTPPCTEAVDFYILMKPALMANTQLTKFKTAIGWPTGNFRPAQPLGSRTRNGCTTALAVSSDWYPYSHHNWATQTSNAAAICKDGSEQSPINFPTCATPDSRAAPEITWKTQTVALINNGHTVQLTPQAIAPGKMAFQIGGITKTYTLAQCHFHFGSEHQINNVQKSFEAHCVHTMDGIPTGRRYGVFGVFYDAPNTGGTANAFLQKFEDQLVDNAASKNKRRLNASEVSYDLMGNPMDATTKRRLAATTTSAFTGPLNFRDLYTGASLTNYWNYDGSFTTPPCTEAVDFYIFMDVLTMSADQLTKFKNAIGWKTAGGNYRPPQALRARTIYGCGKVPASIGDYPWYPYDAKKWEDGVGAASNGLCRHGTMQSPIDFQMCATPTDRTPIKITWATMQPVELVNTGHGVQLNAKGSSPGKMTVNSKTYTLVQCHFHWGAEHFVSTKQYPFEAHCVHTKDGTSGETSRYGVFGQFYDIGAKADPFLEVFQSQLPQKARRLSESGGSGQNFSFNLFGSPLDSDTGRRLGTAVMSDFKGPINFNQLYGANSLTHYWDYSGSFTTPPCTEAVDFYIMMDTASITAGQLDKFKLAIGWGTAKGNFRPPQALGSRTVSGCTTVVADGTDWYPYSFSNWAKTVDNKHVLCRDGQYQSPIDFPSCHAAIKRTAPTITWANQAVELLNNGYTIQINAKGSPSGKMTYSIGGTTKAYTLVQCHYHFGSEHFIGGKQIDAELHCVHSYDASTSLNVRYGVFGIFLEVGFKENLFLKEIAFHMPQHDSSKNKRRLLEDNATDSTIGFDVMGNPMDSVTKRRLASAPPKVSAYVGPTDFKKIYDGIDLEYYWNYEGSFTTPPCTEAVDFYIYMERSSMTGAQYTSLKNAIGWKTAGGNYRPPQALHGRSIYGCSALPAAAASQAWYPYTASKWSTAVGANSNMICSTGQHQSPIDFVMCAKPENRPQIVISWANQAVVLINNGYTVQLTANGASKGKMMVNMKTYTLVQCHFHWVSEHTVSTKVMPFEVHCVHQQDTTTEAKNYGVFGQFYDLGAENAFLKTFEDQLPVKARRLQQEESPVNVSLDLFGNNRRLATTVTSSFTGPVDFKQLYGSNPLTNYWDYHGSFTTPPCTEAVDFYIMMHHATLSKAQYDKFKAAIKWTTEGGNYRPPQALNSRTVSGCKTIVAASTEFYPYSHHNWASLVTGANHICKDGAAQSPIDFPMCQGATKRTAPTITWAKQSVELLNNGHTVQLTAKGATKGGMSFQLSGLTKAYTLVQCHYHHGAEHFVGGTQSELEAHCVHQMDGTSSNPRYGVFGIMYKVGYKQDAFLAQFEDYLPAHTYSAKKRVLEESPIQFDVFGNPMGANLSDRRLASNVVSQSYFGPTDFKLLYADITLEYYWNYEGSFTTPPCTEAVDFYIFMEYGKVTGAQLTKVRDAIGWKLAGGNFRPPQPLGSRTIYGCGVSPPTVQDLAWYPYNADTWAANVGTKSNWICKHGSEQSPIDFPSCLEPKTMPAIGITWATQNVELINNGYTVQLTAKGVAPGKMTVGAKTYTLVQCHFHYGSEHTIGTKQLPFEVHCVHAQDLNTMAPHYGVLGQFYNIGAENAWLKPFQSLLPVKARRLEASNTSLDDENISFDVMGNPLDVTSKRRLATTTKSSYTGPVNFKGLYGSNTLTQYWSYSGSFTTPPCTEAVDFYILMTPATLTQAQLDLFKAAIKWGTGVTPPGNFRPPQPLNSRGITGCASALSPWYPYGADKWATAVSNAHAICKHGREQSPINFPVCSNPPTRPSPVITWATQKVELINNGYTIQINPKGGNHGKMSFDVAGTTKVYTLAQCHFHYPAEHTISSSTQIFETHCVHTRDDKSGRYGVFGIWYELSTTANAFLADIENHLVQHTDSKNKRRLDASDGMNTTGVSFDLMGNPLNADTKRRLATSVVSAFVGPLDFKKLYMGVDLTKYWNYDGSLTTPPCVEAVDFYLFMTKVGMSQSQLDKFKDAIGWKLAGGNYRPPQPLGSRTIYGCGTLPTKTSSTASWYPYTAKNWESKVGAKSAKVCATGLKQSPIDFLQCAVPESRKAIRLTWERQAVELFNNGYAVQLDAQGSPKGQMIVEIGTTNKTYTLVQCHFHWSSEHTISTKQMPFEAHCVHTNDQRTGYYGVFGIFYQVGATENAFLKGFEDHLPSKPSRRRLGSETENFDMGVSENDESLLVLGSQSSSLDIEKESLAFDLFGDPMGNQTGRRLASGKTVSTFKGPVSFKDLYGANTLKNYWDYEGSFTTPPCTEAVDFYIMMHPEVMTKAQLTKFQLAIGWGTEGGNFRPPQPLGSRSVSGCTTSVPISDKFYPYSHVNWASYVSNANMVCKNGVHQSPINFQACSNPLNRTAPEITWASQTVELINNGYTVQITAKGAAPGKMTFDLAGIKKTYTLVQCHFHFSSEHTIGGNQLPFEVHCVHTFDSTSITARYGVFGVFYEVGSAANTFLDLLLKPTNHLPTHPHSISKRRLSTGVNVSEDDTDADAVVYDLFGSPMDYETKRRLAATVTKSTTFTGPLDFKKLYDGVALDKYWNYEGSFTTPPCTEAVDFYIFMSKAKMDQVQLDAFKTAIGWKKAGGNFRPPQALNTRTIYGCSNKPSAVQDKPWYPYEADKWATAVGAVSNQKCKDGKAQSPVNFVGCKNPLERTAIAITYPKQSVELINNGHTVQITPKGADTGRMSAKGKIYALVQCHFHWPSEHTVNTKTTVFEAHCVHSQEAGEAVRYGVLGLFYHEGNENPVLKEFSDKLPQVPTRRLASAPSGWAFDVFGNPLDAKTERRLYSSSVTKSSWTGPFDFKKMFALSAPLTHYWSYEGSFTTPPCTEAVDFYILMEQASMSTDQLNKFKTAIGWSTAGGNYRPPQPLLSRTVLGCTLPQVGDPAISDEVDAAFQPGSTLVLLVLLASLLRQ